MLMVVNHSNNHSYDASCTVGISEASVHHWVLMKHKQENPNKTKNCLADLKKIFDV